MDDFEELLKIQRRMQKKIQEEQEIDDTMDVLMIFNELAPHPDQRIQREQMLIEGSLRGIVESHMNKVIDKLIIDRILMMPSPGWLQRK